MAPAAPHPRDRLLPGRLPRGGSPPLGDQLGGLHGGAGRGPQPSVLGGVRYPRAPPFLIASSRLSPRSVSPTSVSSGSARTARTTSWPIFPRAPLTSTGIGMRLSRSGSRVIPTVLAPRVGRKGMVSADAVL